MEIKRTTEEEYQIEHKEFQMDNKSPCKDCKNQEYCNKSQYCKDYIEWKKQKTNSRKI